MGEVISLESARRRITGPNGIVARRPVTFWFDPLSPEAYLAAERVERQLAGAVWVPVAPMAVAQADVLPRVTARAAALRMPLVWPEAAASPRTLRVATLAAERGVLPAFALAVGRLAYCGGFDLDDPEILAEAAAAAALDLDDCLAAASDTRRDAEPQRTTAMLVTRGASVLPVIEVAGTLFDGEERLVEALAAARAPLPAGHRTPRVG